MVLALSTVSIKMAQPTALLSGKLLSMGYGFVEYRKPEAAQKAMRQLQVRYRFTKGSSIKMNFKMLCLMLAENLPIKAVTFRV